MRLSPKGFVNRAEGFSPAARVLRQAAAAGLKPSATTTKATSVAWEQHVSLPGEWSLYQQTGPYIRR